MFQARYILTCAAVFALVLSLGCHGNPASPDLQPQIESHQLSESAGAGSHRCLGLGLLAIDTVNCAVEVRPSRSTEWHFNVTGVLNTTMGVSAEMVPSESDPPNGLFVLDITLTHPFGSKPQLAGFDVKGILMTPGTLNLGPLVLADIDETRLENADGYTRWWNPSEFTQPGVLGYTKGNLALGPSGALTATVNPYKLFADILCAECPLSLASDEPLDSDQGRAVFTAGSGNTRRYRIRFPLDPGPQVLYGYAVDCAWDIPDPNPPTEIPDDFPIEANQPEAFRLGCVPTANSLYYDSEAGVGGGVLRLQINVHDWQGQLAGDIPSEISAVRVFAPDLMAGGIDGVFLNETDKKARYTADLAGLAEPTEAGEVLVICRVGSSDGSTYQQGTQPAPDSALSAYHVISVEITDPECAADNTNDWGEAVELEPGTSVADQICLPDDPADFYYFDVPLGHEPEGEITIYCDAEPTELSLHNSDHDLVDSVAVSGGLATLALDNGLMPDRYFVRVQTSCDTQVGVYLLDPLLEITIVIPSSPVEVTPPWLYCEPELVWLHGDNAYLFGNGYWAYDISDHANPVQLAHGEIWEWRAACFVYPYLYFSRYLGSDESQVNLVDFSNPSSPVMYEDVIHHVGWTGEVCMNSSHLYTCTGSGAVTEVRVYEYSSDPLNPTFVGNFDVPGSSTMNLLDPEGPETHLVIRAGKDIVTFDVEDPSSASQTGTYTFPTGWPQYIATHEDYIFVTHQESGQDGWLYVFRQTEVPSLVEEAALDIPGGVNHITHQSPYVFIGAGDDGFTICDVTDPTAPSHVVTYPEVQDGTALDVLGGTLCVIPYKAGLRIFDVTDVNSPVFRHHLQVLNYPYEAEASGDYLFAADSTGQYSAVKALDISDPAGARIVSQWDAPRSLVHLCLDGTIMAVSGGEDWWLLNASNPLNLSQEFSGSATDWVSAMGILENALYICDNSPIVGVYDITTPSSPTFKVSFSPCSAATDIAFHADYMYLSIGSQVEIYSIADPFAPVYAGAYSIADVQDICICNDHLYMVTEGGTLEVAELSDPSTPSLVGSETGFAASSLYYLTAFGQFAYVGGGLTPPYALWAWPPDNPDFIGAVYDFPSDHGMIDLVVHDGFLYEVCPGWGIHIYDLY